MEAQSDTSNAFSNGAGFKKVGYSGHADRHHILQTSNFKKHYDKMDSSDQYDVLNAALTAADKYPANLLRSQLFKHDLVAYNEALRQQESRLFEDDPEFSGVKLFEAYDGCGKSAL